MMREAFMATPFKARAEDSWCRGTISGISAANTGQRIARPMPLAKVSASSSGGVIRWKITATHSTAAVPASQNCVTMK
jgi:hypothetical protein